MQWVHFRPRQFTDFPLNAFLYISMNVSWKIILAMYELLKYYLKERVRMHQLPEKCDKWIRAGQCVPGEQRETKKMSQSQTMWQKKGDKKERKGGKEERRGEKEASRKGGRSLEDCGLWRAIFFAGYDRREKERESERESARESRVGEKGAVKSSESLTA